MKKYVAMLLCLCMTMFGLAACGNASPKETISNSNGGEHAIDVDGETASYENIIVEKTGDSDGDESDFTGTNAAVYAQNGGSLTMSKSEINTAGKHANAVFAYGEKSSIEISDSIIKTSENNSGGIMVTGGGSIKASDLNIETKGGSSAAIRSDRGGGTITVDGGTYSSYGSGSPAIYSTADITVNDATLYSDVSEAVVIEGKNSVKLNNVTATGKNSVQNSNNTDKKKAVMVYQSMSGDASEGEGEFEMTGGTLESQEGGMFYVTNTIADISLSSVELKYATDDLLSVEKAGWGTDGSNGGQVNFSAEKQKLEGVIAVDEISKANIQLEDGSEFKGQIKSAGETFVDLDKKSTWTLTGDSEISSLNCPANAIKLNGFTLKVNGKTYKEGTASKGEEIEFEVPKAGDGNGQPPEPPDGGNGQPPAKPDGDDNGQPPEPPEGSNGQPPAKPDGNGQPPEPPDGNGQPPAKPDGGNGQ